MRCLNGHSGTAALALQFLILTASRSYPVRFARWNEFQILANEKAIWHVPGKNMKSGEDFDVPIAAAGLAVLRKAKLLRTGPESFVFPSPLKPGKPLSDGAMRRVLKKNADGFTVHGFRSSFRDWCEGDMVSYPHEVKEAALAHTVSNKTERAYRRTDYLEQRIDLMREWSEFLSEPDDENNLQLGISDEELVKIAMSAKREV